MILSLTELSDSVGGTIYGQTQTGLHMVLNFSKARHLKMSGSLTSEIINSAKMSIILACS